MADLFFFLNISYHWAQMKLTENNIDKSQITVVRDMAAIS